LEHASANHDAGENSGPLARQDLAPQVPLCALVVSS
jgi:hypothetical protein